MSKAPTMVELSSLKGKSFRPSNDQPWHEVGDGVRRKILAYDENVMMVHVEFSEGAIGPLHSHPHLQCTLIESGTFDVSIGGITQRLNAGDSFFVPTLVAHGVVALSAGRIVDSFTPMRQDFLESE